MLKVFKNIFFRSSSRPIIGISDKGDADFSHIEVADAIDPNADGDERREIRKPERVAKEQLASETLGRPITVAGPERSTRGKKRKIVLTQNATCIYARGIFTADLTKLGTRRGKAYAFRFAVNFAVWMENRDGFDRPWHTNEIVLMAYELFAKPTGTEMPVVRNFLSALKKYPGVKAEKHVRMYNEEGAYLGKGTFYSLPF